MSSYSETEIIPVVLQIIKENPGIVTSDIISKAMDRMNPSGDDLTILLNRSDTKFSQKVRNIKSHRSLQGKVRTEGTRNCNWYLI